MDEMDKRQRFKKKKYEIMINLLILFVNKTHKLYHI